MLPVLFGASILVVVFGNLLSESIDHLNIVHVFERRCVQRMVYWVDRCGYKMGRADTFEARLTFSIRVDVPVSL